MSNAAYSFDALMDITTRPKTVFVRGEGSWLWDDTGKRYLDFIQGWAVNCLGHSPPAVAEAIAAQAKTLITAIPNERMQPTTRPIVSGRLMKSQRAVHSNRANNTFAVTMTSG